MVAFTRAVSETLGEERKWVHYGLTSSDVVDTAQSLRLLRANKILRAGLVRLGDGRRHALELVPEDPERLAGANQARESVHQALGLPNCGTSANTGCKGQLCTG